VHEVTEKQLAALVFDTSRDERFAASESIVSSGVRSLVAAPLVDPESCPGMIVLSSRANVRQFSEEDMELLVSLASVAALRIRNIALAEDAARRRALEKELELARAIQVALLPEKLPQVRGYELHAVNAPSRAVSGDLYQVQMRSDDRECVVLIADVSGKGIGAAQLGRSGNRARRSQQARARRPGLGQARRSRGPAGRAGPDAALTLDPVQLPTRSQAPTTVTGWLSSARRRPAVLVGSRKRPIWARTVARS